MSAGQYVAPLPLDLGVEIRHPETGASGKVIDVWHEGAWIRGEFREYPVYLVNFPGLGQQLSNSATGWAKAGWKVVAPTPDYSSYAYDWYAEER